MCPNISLVLLIGLPGSGKTTLCKHLKTIWDGKAIKEEIIHIVHICFDDIIPLQEQEKFALKQLVTGDKDISSIEGQSEVVDVETVEEECWKAARKKVHNQVEDLIEAIKGRKSENPFQVYLPEITVGNGIHYIILVDDNFYYRSMRYEYYQLARKYTLRFGQVYVDCAVDVAMKQNKQRTTQVPEKVIISMDKKLEIPEPDKISWEANSFSVELDLNDNFDFIGDLLMSQPVEPLVDRTEEIKMAQLICSKSVIHQADLILRSLVAETIKEAKLKSTFPPQQMKTWAAGVNSARQTILSKLREGILFPPAHLIYEGFTESKDDFKNWLCIEFQRAVSDL
ncbi:phosphoseryl tRNA kinase [Oratosquilla oratoria]|uniref:phosphoseryl tRNA kinase n=1 Tax=Oratosquilla oratoria TaxID=337810 RepID=UPI003F7739BE